MSDILYRAELHAFFLVDHQGRSQSGHHTNTGFSFFKLLTCGQLQKGRATPIWSPTYSGS